MARHTPLENLLLARNELGDAGAKALAAALSEAAGVYRGQLARLDLSENQITATGFAALLGSLSKNTVLRRLDVGGNESIGAGIMDTPDTAQEVIAGLGSASGLRDLHLWRCGLS